jgi:tagatose 1,6-diphosphate aldolase GatY/KbaY
MRVINVVSVQPKGFVQNTKEMLLRAGRGTYAVPAFNIHNLETIQTVIEAAVEMRSPIILAATPGTMKYAGRSYIQAIVEVAAKENDIPIALHLDHHETYESIVESLDLGTKSVMIDGSHLSFEENIALSKKVADKAHEYGATVEAELGKLVGQEDDLVVESKDAAYTDPDTVQEFVARTGIDSLAVAIGTGHGLYDMEPHLDFARLTKIKSLVDVPIVLHGASGISKEDVQKCISLGCAKVNISTELKIPFSTGLRDSLMKNLNETDPRKYFGLAKAKMKEAVIEKILICKSNGKA